MKEQSSGMFYIVFSCSVVSDSLQPHVLQPIRLLCPWGYSRQGYWSRLPRPPPGDLPNPGMEPRSPALQTDSLLSEPPGKPSFTISSVQSLSHVRLFATPWTAACQASLSINNYQSLLKLMSIESVMPSNHLILCWLLLLPSIFPSIRVFSGESALRIKWPKYWSFSFNISPSNEHPGLISFRMDLLAVQGTLKSLLQHHSSKAAIPWRLAFFIVQLSHPYMSTETSLNNLIIKYRKIVLSL